LPFRREERLGRLASARGPLAIISARVVLLFPVVEQESPRLFGYPGYRSGIRQVWQVVTADAGCPFHVNVAKREFWKITGSEVAPLENFPQILRLARIDVLVLVRCPPLRYNRRTVQPGAAMDRSKLVEAVKVRASPVLLGCRQIDDARSGGVDRGDCCSPSHCDRVVFCWWQKEDQQIPKQGRDSDFRGSHRAQ
jgi:hypothetical protein